MPTPITTPEDMLEAVLPALWEVYSTNARAYWRDYEAAVRALRSRIAPQPESDDKETSDA